MSSSVFKEYPSSALTEDADSRDGQPQLVSGGGGGNLVVFINKDGSVSVDQEALHDLLVNDATATNTSVSVIRVSSPTPSLQEELDEQHELERQLSQLYEQDDGDGQVATEQQEQHQQPMAKKAAAEKRTTRSSGRKAAASDVRADEPEAGDAEEEEEDDADETEADQLGQGGGDASEDYDEEEEEEGDDTDDDDEAANDKTDTEEATAADGDGKRRRRRRKQQVPQISLMVENYYTPQQAKQLASEILSIAGIINPLQITVDFEFQRSVIANDHCYTPFTSPSQQLEHLQLQQQQHQPHTGSKSHRAAHTRKRLALSALQSPPVDTIVLSTDDEDETASAGTSAGRQKEATAGATADGGAEADADGDEADEEYEEYDESEGSYQSPSESDRDSDLDFSVNDREATRARKLLRSRTQRQKQRQQLQQLERQKSGELQTSSSKSAAASAPPAKKQRQSTAAETGGDEDAAQTHGKRKSGTAKGVKKAVATEAGDAAPAVKAALSSTPKVPRRLAAEAATPTASKVAAAVLLSPPTAAASAAATPLSPPAIRPKPAAAADKAKPPLPAPSSRLLSSAPQPPQQQQQQQPPPPQMQRVTPTFVHQAASGQVRQIVGSVQQRPAALANRVVLVRKDGNGVGTPQQPPANIASASGVAMQQSAQRKVTSTANGSFVVSTPRDPQSRAGQQQQQQHQQPPIQPRLVHTIQGVKKAAPIDGNALFSTPDIIRKVDTMAGTSAAAAGAGAKGGAASASAVPPNNRVTNISVITLPPVTLTPLSGGASIAGANLNNRTMIIKSASAAAAAAAASSLPASTVIRVPGRQPPQQQQQQQQTQPRLITSQSLAVIRPTLQTVRSSPAQPMNHNNRATPNQRILMQPSSQGAAIIQGQQHPKPSPQLNKLPIQLQNNWQLQQQPKVVLIAPPPNVLHRLQQPQQPQLLLHNQHQQYQQPAPNCQPTPPPSAGSSQQHVLSQASSSSHTHHNHHHLAFPATVEPITADTPLLSADCDQLLDDCLTEDLLQHVAKLAEDKNLQQVIDQQVLAAAAGSYQSQPQPPPQQQHMKSFVAATTTPPHPLHQSTPVATPKTAPQSSPAIATPHSTASKTPATGGGIKIVRPDGRVITLPPIEAPTTRGAKRRAQSGNQSADGAAAAAAGGSRSAAASPANTPASSTPKSRRASVAPPPDRRASVAVGRLSSGTGRKSQQPSAAATSAAAASQPATTDASAGGEIINLTDDDDDDGGGGDSAAGAENTATDAAGAADDYDDASDGSYNSEDDPHRLWCICRQPHNNRFMICCDKCEDWFHGKCVSVTKAMGTELEQQGIEWVCPNCLKKHPHLQQRQLAVLAGGSGKKQTPSRKASTASATSGHSTPATKPVAAAPCAVCQVAAARPNSIYCSDNCIQAHAQATTTPTLIVAAPAAAASSTTSATPDTPTARNAAAKPAPQPPLAKKIRPVPTRISTSAPTPRSTPPRSTPTTPTAPATPPTPPVIMPKPIIVPCAPPAVRIDVYERRTGRVLTGNAAPTSAELKRWLADHPSFEVVNPGSAHAAAIQAKRQQLKQLARDMQQQGQRQQRTAATASATKVQTILQVGPQRKMQLVTPAGSPVSGQRSATTAAVPVARSAAPRLSGGPTPAAGATASAKSQPPARAATAGAEPSTARPAKPVTDPVRLNVQRNLREQLQLRMNELPDAASDAAHPKLSADDIQQFVCDTELALWLHFGRDTGTKYRAKYGSIKFNLTDRKNATLFRKICERSCGAADLVRMSAEEMASQELARWREREQQRELEMIKQTELDLLARAQSQALGDGGQSMAASGMLEDVVLAASGAAGAVVSGSGGEQSGAEAKDTRIDARLERGAGGTASTKAAKSGGGGKKRARSRSREPGGDDNSSTSSGARHSDSKRARDGRSGEQHQQQQRSSGRDKHRSSASKGSDRRAKDSGKEPERDRPAKVSSSSGARKEQAPPKPAIAADGLDMTDKLLRAQSTINRILGNAAEVDITKLPAAKEPSLNAVAKKEPPTSDTAAEVINLDDDESNDAANADIPESAAAAALPAAIWTGSIFMIDVATFQISVSPVLGDAGSLPGELPAELEIVGRIRAEQVWDYVHKLRKSQHNDVRIVRFGSGSADDEEAYYTLYEYMLTRKRYGVIKPKCAFIKDFYIFPLEADGALPAVLPQTGEEFEVGRPNLLMGLMVFNRLSGSSRRAAAGMGAAMAVAAAGAQASKMSRSGDSAPPPPAATGAKQHPALLKGKASELLRESTRSASPRRLATPPIVSHIPAAAAEQPIASAFATSATTSKAPLISAVLDDGDEPYSPGGASSNPDDDDDDDDDYVDDDAIVRRIAKSTAVAASSASHAASALHPAASFYPPPPPPPPLLSAQPAHPTTTIASIPGLGAAADIVADLNETEIQRHVAELTRRIEQQKQEIAGMLHDTNGPHLEQLHQLDEPYSPSAILDDTSSSGSGVASAAVVAQPQRSALDQIAIPSNLQEILNSIKASATMPSAAALSYADQEYDPLAAGGGGSVRLAYPAKSDSKLAQLTDEQLMRMVPDAERAALAVPPAAKYARFGPEAAGNDEYVP